MPIFSSIFLPFLVNQTQKHKHKLTSSKNKNTNTNPTTNLPCQPNTKATNTNPATDFSCQPNTNPNISKNTNTNPAIHLQKTQKTQINHLRKMGCSRKGSIWDCDQKSHWNWRGSHLMSMNTTCLIMIQTCTSRWLGTHLKCWQFSTLFWWTLWDELNPCLKSTFKLGFLILRAPL